ncbi:oligoendopeptidase F [Opitutus terrae PB90-1]|uniref:Oligopeptidase F n=2 Tax=Opitutus terrae TaxID=107709 RepID=B1ZZH2_OPITP|nr:oligoendopeptidase F [Opitutus terrae PB90-1]
MFFATLPWFSPLLHAADSAAPAADPGTTWDLTPLYADEAAWRAAKDRVAAGIPKIKDFEGRLGESAATLLQAMDFVQGLRDEFVRLSVYASLVLDENTRNSAALERTQELGLLGTQFAQAMSVIDPELLVVGEEKIRGFLDREPGLKPYRFSLLEVLRAAPHTLGREAEGVLSAASLVTGTPGSLYGILANADMPWPTIKLSDGTEARLDQSGYARWRASANRADREAVFDAFWKKVRDYERTFGVTLFSQMKTDWFNASTRKYPSTLAAALDADNIPEAVYRTLLAETNANLPTLHRYFKLRARMLGVSEMHYWDIYPPIVALDKKFPLSTSRDLAIHAVAPLGAEYQKLFADSLSGRYTHYYPQPGKRAGAYMNGSVHNAHAYVLMNYNDDYESLSTLAHEWGHGVHSLLANANQPSPDARYSIFTAEIASTQNEVLLLDHMLKVAQSDDERLYYLGSALENMRGTFFRQAMFAEFELAIHEAVEKGNSLSGAKLSQMYGDILRRYHGDAQGVVKIDDLVTVEWAYIPHFYRRFYVYQYATSIAAGTAFADRILAHEPGAVDTYLGLLKAGGSDHPYELVKRAGVDLATPAPYRALVARMNSIMDQIEAILAKRNR